jgi:5'-nucleotidase
VTYKKVFTVQPFSNVLTVVDLKGQDIKDALEQQFSATRTFILQISDSLRYTYTAGNPFGSKVDAASITIDGLAINLAATYRVVINNFLAGGGDGFVALGKGTNRVSAPIDLDAFIAFFVAHDPVMPPLLNRITMQ